MFCFQATGGDISGFISQTNERLNNPAMFKNPFSDSFIRKLELNNQEYYVVSMTSIFPRIDIMVPLLTFIIGIIIYLFLFSNIGIFIIPLFFLLYYIFGSDLFFYWMLKLGVRKYNKEIDIERCSNDKVLELLIRCPKQIYC